MSIITTEERIALLLNVLGDDVAEVAFQSMNPTRANFVRTLLEDFKRNPPSEDEIEFVLSDFSQYFDFAIKAIQPEKGKGNRNGVGGAGDPSASENLNGGTQPTVVYFPEVELTDDPVHDLNELDPYQVATAIADDHPKTIALVAKSLTTGRAAKVLEFLSEEKRAEAIVYLSQNVAVAPAVLKPMLQTVVRKAASIRSRTEEVDQTQVLAELMRSFPKQLRAGLMEKLAEVNEEVCQQVKSKLYVFEDVMRLDDRDIQKILGEVETDNLIVGLQKADQTIVDKLLSNLSKRARETILEEMQYKTNATQEEIDQARASLIEVLARLDESGDITLQ